MMRQLAVIICALLVAQINQSAYADNSIGLRATALIGAALPGGDGLSTRFTVEPSFLASADNLEVRGAARLRALRINDVASSGAAIRELFLAYRNQGFTATLGAQQVNWGRMDIIRITDVVNPVDSSDLYYEEMPEAKKPLWMANFESQSGGNVLQLLLSPDVSADTVPDRIGGFPAIVQKPGQSARNATYAARYGFEAASWNVDLVAYRGWDASPSFTVQAVTPTPSLVGQINRLTKVGFSADRPFGAIVVRAEFAYSPQQAYSGISTAPPQKTSRFTAGLGIDMQTNQWFLAGQVIVDKFSEPDIRGWAPQQNIYASVAAQRKWLQDRLSFRVAAITELEKRSYWISAQSTYELSANQEVRVQIDRFNGMSDSVFGQLSSRSRIALSYRLKY